ncbi:MAG: hypothetical protein M1561_00150 [Gammaproteobacteria bacterium]|nr:hypothetical protein [Gammaproteobacteria bacterium]
MSTPGKPRLVLDPNFLGRADTKTDAKGQYRLVLFGQPSAQIVAQKMVFVPLAKVATPAVPDDKKSVDQTLAPPQPEARSRSRSMTGWVTPAPQFLPPQDSITLFPERVPELEKRIARLECKALKTKLKTHFAEIVTNEDLYDNFFNSEDCARKIVRFNALYQEVNEALGKDEYALKDAREYIAIVLKDKKAVTDFNYRVGLYQTRVTRDLPEMIEALRGLGAIKRRTTDDEPKLTEAEAKDCIVQDKFCDRLIEIILDQAPTLSQRYLKLRYDTDHEHGPELEQIKIQLGNLEAMFKKIIANGHPVSEEQQKTIQEAVSVGQDIDDLQNQLVNPGGDHESKESKEAKHEEKREENHASASVIASSDASQLASHDTDAATTQMHNIPSSSSAAMLLSLNASAPNASQSASSSQPLQRGDSLTAAALVGLPSELPPGIARTNTDTVLRALGGGGTASAEDAHAAQVFAASI